MRIGLISDSHKKIDLLKDAIKQLKKDKAEYIIHAGDIVLKESLDLLEKSALPYTAILGNNDNHLIEYVDKYNLFKEPHYFSVNSFKIKLMHLPFYLNNDSDIIINGHTHYFNAEVKNGTLYVNPGEICARKKPISEFAMIEDEKDKWIVYNYQKNISKHEEHYSIEKLKFKR